MQREAEVKDKEDLQEDTNLDQGQDPFLFIEDKMKERMKETRAKPNLFILEIYPIVLLKAS